MSEKRSKVGTLIVFEDIDIQVVTYNVHTVGRDTSEEAKTMEGSVSVLLKAL